MAQLGHLFVPGSITEPQDVLTCVFVVSEAGTVTRRKGRESWAEIPHDLEWGIVRIK